MQATQPTRRRPYSSAIPGVAEIDDVVTCTETLLLVPRHRTIRRPRHPPTGELMLGVTDSPYLLGVVVIVRREVQPISGPEQCDESVGDVVAYETAMTMTVLRPRVRKEDPDSRQRVG